MLKIVRAAVGIVVGYALMVVLITLVQEGWFGGVQYGRSSWGVLLAAGALTALSAAIGGTVATIISLATGRAAAVLMSSVVVVETTVLVTTGRVAGPLWFDLMGSASLIVSILAAAELCLRWPQLGMRQPAAHVTTAR
ncbi:MAG: hypothetical protein ACREAA_05880 [Candidatus Polarisedimenticolia bacterium]